MKTFVCAISTFAVLLVLVILNGALFSQMTDKILGQIDKASDLSSTKEERVEAVNEIRKTFDEGTLLLSVSVGHDEISSLSAFVSDAEHQVYGDEGQFLSALEKLRTDINRLRTSECFCLDGLF